MVIPRFSGRHWWKLHGLHQAVHSADADADTIITLKNMCDLVGSDPLFVICIDLEDEPSDLLVFNGSCSRSGIEMLVVCAPVNFQDPAERLDVVLAGEPANSI